MANIVYSMLYKIDDNNYLKKCIDNYFNSYISACSYNYYVDGIYRGSVTARQLSFQKYGYVSNEEIDNMAIESFKSYVESIKHIK